MRANDQILVHKSSYAASAALLGLYINELAKVREVLGVGGKSGSEDKWKSFSTGLPAATKASLLLLFGGHLGNRCSSFVWGMHFRSDSEEQFSCHMVMLLGMPVLQAGTHIIVGGILLVFLRCYIFKLINDARWSQQSSLPLATLPSSCQSAEFATQPWHKQQHHRLVQTIPYLPDSLMFCWWNLLVWRQCKQVVDRLHWNASAIEVSISFLSVGLEADSTVDWCCI